MKKINDFIVYRKDICKIVDIKKKEFNNMDYYSLVPIDDNSLKIEVPVDNKNNLLRDLITYDEVENIIKEIPNIETIDTDDKYLESEYKKLLSTGRHTDLVKIIKTTYLRNKNRLDNKKKLSDKDNNYFKLAEKYLYNEFSIVLNMNYDDTKDYVIENVKSLTKENA